MRSAPLLLLPSQLAWTGIQSNSACGQASDITLFASLHSHDEISMVTPVVWRALVELVKAAHPAASVRFPWHQA